MLPHVGRRACGVLLVAGMNVSPLSRRCSLPTGWVMVGANARSSECSVVPQRPCTTTGASWRDLRLTPGVRRGRTGDKSHEVNTESGITGLTNAGQRGREREFKNALFILLLSQNEWHNNSVASVHLCITTYASMWSSDR